MSTLNFCGDYKKIYSGTTTTSATSLVVDIDKYCGFTPKAGGVTMTYGAYTINGLIHIIGDATGTAYGFCSFSADYYYSSGLNYKGLRNASYGGLITAVAPSVNSSNPRLTFTITSSAASPYILWAEAFTVTSA